MKNIKNLSSIDGIDFNNENSRDYYEKILSCILDIGEILLKSGSEINRIEDTMIRISKAYDFIRIDVLVITSSIIVTAQTKNEDIISQTRRITGRQTDMNKIEMVNDLSRKICKNPVAIKNLKHEIFQINNTKGYPTWVIYIIYASIAATFSIFFGGVWLDAVAAAICGLFLKAFLDVGTKIKMQNIVLTILASTFSGYLAYFLVFCHLGINPDKIIIGIIMLLIPGVALTSSLKDMLIGDLIKVVYVIDKR
ncbi:MAG: threonine/serine exporter family protein [Oscillospiraceae bacterium]